MKMKAYQFDDDNGESGIYYGTTAGEAKAEVIMDYHYLGLEFKDIRVYRVPWADKYGIMENIPVEELLKHGWWYECERCGKEINEDDLDNGELFFEDNTVYCRECWESIREEK